MSSTNMAFVPLLVFLLYILKAAEALNIPLTAYKNETEWPVSISNSSLISLISRQAGIPIPDPTPFYDWRNYFDFHQFSQAPPEENLPDEQAHINLIIRCMQQIMNILLVTRDTLTEQQIKGQPDNPALLRYGPTNSAMPPSQWLALMNNIIDRILAALGSPPYHDPVTRQQCFPGIGKLQIYYQTPPFDIPPSYGCLGDSGLFAYAFFYGRLGQEGLCFCQHFFDTYKDLTQVDPSKFAPYFELGYKQEQHEPTWFSASVVLHELFHYAKIYRDVWQLPDGNSPIKDQTIHDPDGPIGGSQIAYGAFNALKIKDPLWPWYKPGTTEEIPLEERFALSNDDNWRFFILENYFRKKFNLPDWQESPDLHTGPHYPQGYPIPDPPPERR